MNKCYFCGKECGETVLTVSDKTSFQSELFRAYMCAECSEAVHNEEEGELPYIKYSGEFTKYPRHAEWRDKCALCGSRNFEGDCAVDGGADCIIPSADVQPAPKYTENMSTIAFCDRFICKNCDIHLEDWVKVVIDPDDGDELHYEYEFKFCPECGARVKDGET